MIDQLDDQAQPLADVVERARAGDEGALTTLIERYQSRIGRFVRSIVGADDEVEDLAQTIFVKMVLRIDGLKSIETFEPWLFLIARNTCRDHLRRRKWRRLFVPWETDHEHIPAPVSEMPARGLAGFDDAIAELPREQRELITMLREKDWSQEQLSQMTGASVGAIKSRLFRARKRIREIIGQREPNDEA